MSVARKLRGRKERPLLHMMTWIRVFRCFMQVLRQWGECS
jgi:hypothetical protein